MCTEPHAGIAVFKLLRLSSETIPAANRCDGLIQHQDGRHGGGSGVMRPKSLSVW